MVSTRQVRAVVQTLVGELELSAAVRSFYAESRLLTNRKLKEELAEAKAEVDRQAALREMQLEAALAQSRAAEAEVDVMKGRLAAVESDMTTGEQAAAKVLRPARHQEPGAHGGGLTLSPTPRQIMMKARFLMERRDDLRTELRRRGLSVTGLKSQLAERLARDSDVSLETCRAIAGATGAAAGGVGLRHITNVSDLESNTRLRRRLTELRGANHP